MPPKDLMAMPASPAPAPVSLEAVASALKKAADGPLPSLVLEPAGEDVRLSLEYPDAALHAARCSADAAAVRALAGPRLAAAEQRDVVLSRHSGKPLPPGFLPAENDAAPGGCTCSFVIRRA